MGQILHNRGVTDVADFFDLDWNCVQSPHDLDYADAAAERIIRAMRDSEKVAMLVDVDVDGFSSSSLLTNYLRQQMMEYGSFPDSKMEIVHLFHEKKTHGLGDTKVMRQIRDEVKPSLLIVPDASGNAEQYQALVGIGVDVVVMDHHDTKERGDGVKVIVVNNQQSDKYRNKALSGVGVTWQVCRIMDEMLPFCCADQYLDLVALGLIADVMDMRSPETRFLAQEGMKPENVRVPLTTMAPEIFKDYEKMTQHFVGWTLSPAINAITRIGTNQENQLGFGCLLDENMDKMVPNNKRGATGNIEFVREAWRIVTNAKGRQDRRRNKLTQMIEDLIADEALTDNKVIVLAIDDFEDEYRALSGVVANQLIDVYQRPVVLTFLNDDGDYAGSLRAPGHVAAWENFKDMCEKSGCCRYASGHQLAAGICIYGDAVQDFIDYFNDKLADVDVEPGHSVDFIFNAEDERISQLCYDIDACGDIWGSGLEVPKIAVKDVKVGPGTLSLLGKLPTRKTLSIDLPNGVRAIKFGSSQEEFQSLCLPYTTPPQYYRVNIVGTVSINRFGGRETPQILIEDYEVVGVAYDF